MGLGISLSFVSAESCSLFDKNVVLKPSTVNRHVISLQQLLNKDPDTMVATTGPGSQGNETSKYGFGTFTAIVRFQEKYASDVLVPSGLGKGTGFAGFATKAKLRDLYCNPRSGTATTTKTVAAPSSVEATKSPTPLPVNTLPTSVPVGTPSGSVFSSAACTIDLGSSTCSVSVSWNVINPKSPVFKQNDISFFSSATSFSSPRSVSHGTTTFSLFDGSSLLDSKTIVVSCVSGAVWSNGVCALPKEKPVSPLPVVLLPPVATTSKTCLNCFEKRYIYYSANMGKGLYEADPYYKKLSELIVRAKASGYNGIVLSSGGSGSFTGMVSGSVAKYNPYFYKNYEAIIAKAKEHDIEIIPVGGNLSAPVDVDPTLTEALPVKNQKFFVQKGVAKVIQNEILTNPGFESGFSGWGLLDVSVVLDTSTSHTGSSSVKVSQNNPKNMSRVYRSVNGLKPFTSYRVSLWIKTQNYDAPLRFQIYGGKKMNVLFKDRHDGLGWGTTDGVWNASPNTLSKTQEWKQYSIDINTLEDSDISLYVGSWSNGSSNGTAWIDDFSMKEVGLSHPVRRDTLPIKVTSLDESISYKEGKDYSLSVDGSEKLVIPSGSSLKDENTVLVSWYQSPRYMESNWNNPASACGQSFFDIQRQIFEKIKTLFASKGFFFYVDEERVMNWDPSCGSISAGTYLKNLFQKMTATLLSVNPPYEMYVWNDMFDPYSNATSSYYLVNGDLTGSWEGLPSSITVMNWNEQSSDIQVKSLTFFSNMHVKQMLALYYDDPSLGKVSLWMDSLDRAEKGGVTGVNGFMYTTWAGDSNYGDLEKVADLIKTKYPHRWPK